MKAKGKKIIYKYNRLQTAISASKGLNTDYGFFTTPSLFCQSDERLAEITNFKTVPQTGQKTYNYVRIKKQSTTDRQSGW